MGRLAVTRRSGGGTGASDRRVPGIGLVAGIAAGAVVVGLLIGLPRVLRDDGVGVAAPATAVPAPPAGSDIRIEPSTAAPGSTVALYFRDEGVRGAAFTLESPQSLGWTIEYYLISPMGGADPGPDDWFRPDEEIRGWTDHGVSGPGGEKVLIPPDAVPGRYRLCTANATSRLCGALTVG